MFIFVSRRQWGTTKYLQVPRSVCGSLEGPHRPAHVSVVDDRQPQTFRHTRRCHSFPKRNELARSNRQDAGCTTLWKPRDLSLAGRSYVARTLAAFKLWYVAQVVPAPPRMIDEINTAMWKFIWKDHAELVSRRVCCRTRRNGGLARIVIRDKVAAI